MSKISGNERAKQAIAFHDRGFNCAQSVACAFTDKTGMDEKTLFRITEGLGLGMQHRAYPGAGFQEDFV